MPWWIPVMMAASTAVTIMGQNQQKKQVKADTAWKKYEATLNQHAQKQKNFKNQTKLLSEQRARAGASGVAIGSGSSLLVGLADQEEFENDMFMLQKGVDLTMGSLESSKQGKLTALNIAMVGTLAQGATSIASQRQNSAWMDKKYGTVE